MAYHENGVIIPALEAAAAQSDIDQMRQQVEAIKAYCAPTTQTEPTIGPAGRMFERPGKPVGD